MWTDAELERRLPVWSALSSLFLDTSYDDGQYDRIAEQLKRSGFDNAELETILREEIAPAFAFNLLDVAGAWTNWSSDEVREIVLAAHRSGATARAKRAVMQLVASKLVETEWPKLEVRLVA